MPIPPVVRDRLRDWFTRDELELIVYLAWRSRKGDHSVEEQLAALLAEIEPDVHSGRG